MLPLAALLVSRRFDIVRGALVCGALLLGTGSGCTTNHDALAKQPKAGNGGTGGGGGGTGPAGGGFGNTGDVPNQGGRMNPDAEPAGDDVLTIVNGVVDATSVALCFGRLAASGDEYELAGSPLPELAYGAHTVVTELEGFSFAEDTIVPWVIAGELSLVDGLDCAAAVALAAQEEAEATPAEPEPSLAEGGAGGGAGSAAMGGGGGAESPPPLEPSRLRARAMAALPAGTVSIGRSILMVLTGCVGGAAYRDRVEQAACGAAYTPDTPTLEPVVVKMSRQMSYDRIGLQAVHAALAVTSSVDIRSADDLDVALTFASALDFGGVEPRPADVRFGVAELGVTQRDHSLQVVDDSGVLFQQSWPSVRTASGIEEIAASRNYTAVLIGPNPLLVKEGWWNGPAFALVESDPTRQ